MMKTKACDTNGVVVELLKVSGGAMREVVADVFTDLMNPASEVPSYQREARLKDFFKKGDPLNPENYRPICILPILYKLFSRIVCTRIKGILEQSQSVDQEGFRGGFCCDDHLFAITLVAEKMKEYSLPLWVAAVDFKKAFDSINHGSLWQALHELDVPGLYIQLLQKLYDHHEGFVQNDKTSRAFNIEPGTKQGDPISSILLNACLEKVISAAKE